MSFTGALDILTLPSYNDNGPRDHSNSQAMAIDVTNGNLFVSTSSSPLRMRYNIVKIRLSDFSYVTTRPALNTVWQTVASMAIHPPTNRLITTFIPPEGIGDYKGATIGVITTTLAFYNSLGETGFNHVVYDNTRQNIYATGELTSFGWLGLTKLNSTFTKTIIPPSSSPSDAFTEATGVIDNSNTKAFWAMSSRGSGIRRVDLATAVDEGVVAASGVKFSRWRSMDHVNNMAYFINNSSQLVKFNMTTSAIVNAVTTVLSPHGDGSFNTYNQYREKIYAIASGTGSILTIIEIDANNLTITDTLALPAYNPGSYSFGGRRPIAVDGLNGYVYVGAPTTPTQILRIGITAPPSSTIPLSGSNLRRKAPYFDVQSQMNRLSGGEGY